MVSYSSTTTSPSWKYWWRDTGVTETPILPHSDVHTLTPNEANPKLAGLLWLEVLSILAWLRWWRQSLLLNPERDRDDLFPLLIGCKWSICVWVEFRKGYGGRDGLDPGVKRSIRSCKNPLSLANKTSIVQPKLIITGIYTCICNSVCRPKGGFAIVPPDAPTLEEPSSSSEVFRLQLR